MEIKNKSINECSIYIFEFKEVRVYLNNEINRFN